MKGKITLYEPGHWQAEQAARAKLEHDARHAPGPPVDTCDECGAFACYGFHDERFCERHAPESLKRPGDFLDR